MNSAPATPRPLARSPRHALGLARSGVLVVAALAILAGGALASSPAPTKPAPAKPATKQPSKPALPQVAPVSLEQPPTPDTDHHADGQARHAAPGTHTNDAKPAGSVPKPATRAATKPPQHDQHHDPAHSADSPAHASATSASPPGADGELGGSLDPAQALDALKAGNERWLAGKPLNPSTGMLRRQSTASDGQRPFVTVLTCADSRIPVERVFDRGVGEIFVVRVAGNIADQALAGTVEYGVGHLDTKLLVVMGHSKCGAVKATVEGTSAGPNVGAILDRIRPAVLRAQRLNPDVGGDALVDAAVRENVWQTVFDLYRASPDLASQAQTGKLKVVGAVLDISTGRVDWLGEHPWQEALVAALAKPSTHESHAAPAAAVTGVETRATAETDPTGH
jgi:carbonic anhydrase